MPNALVAGVPSAVLFDFNGTISDDEPIVYAAYRHAFAQLVGFELDEEFYDRYLIGRADREIVETTLIHLDRPSCLTDRILASRQHEYQRLVRAKSPIADGVVDLVRELGRQGVPLGLITGAELADVELVLSATQLANEFAVIVTQEDVARGKPDPEGYLSGIEQLGVDPSRAVVFEDSLVGIEAARSAGLLCIAVEGSHSRSELLQVADAVIARLDIRSLETLRKLTP